MRDWCVLYLKKMRKKNEQDNPLKGIYGTREKKKEHREEKHQ